MSRVLLAPCDFDKQRAACRHMTPRLWDTVGVGVGESEEADRTWGRGGGGRRARGAGGGGGEEAARTWGRGGEVARMWSVVVGPACGGGGEAACLWGILRAHLTSSVQARESAEAGPALCVGK